MYVLKWPDGSYVKHRGYYGKYHHRGTYELSKARVFRRRSDASQALAAIPRINFHTGEPMPVAVPVKVKIMEDTD